MADEFAIWLDGAPVLVRSKNETFAAWLDGAPVIDEALLTNPVAGDATLSFTPQGQLAGSGALAGNISLSFTPSAPPSATVSIAGDVTLSFTPAGFGQASVPIVGASDLTFTPAATLGAAGAALGDAPITFTPEGTMSGAGALLGATSLTLTPAGPLSGLVFIVGSTTLTFTGAASGERVKKGTTKEHGNGKSRVEKAASFSEILFLPSGTLAASASLEGTAALEFFVRGYLPLYGVLTLELLPSATLSATGALVGTTGLRFGRLGTAPPIVEDRTTELDSEAKEASFSTTQPETAPTAGRSPSVDMAATIRTDSYADIGATIDSVLL